ncbi:hypothetical protein MY11210_006775 [Beauveria gryllotalpidicola]
MSYAGRLDSFDDARDINRSPLLLCGQFLPENVQEVLFYIAIRHNGQFYPLAVASQMPPTSALWQILLKGFVVESVRKMHAYLSNGCNHPMLAEEVRHARQFYYYQGSETLFGPDEPPGVSSAEDRDLWLDNPAFPHAARALMDNLDGDFWTPVGLYTTMGMYDKRYRAVVFDVTNLDNVACGVVETKLVKETNQFTGVEEENMYRTVVTVPEWVAMETGFESMQGKRDDSAAHRMADFPTIPLINDAVQQMLWAKDRNSSSSSEVSSDSVAASNGQCEAQKEPSEAKSEDA